MKNCIIAVAAMLAGCGGDVKPIKNAAPLVVHTLPPASFWICPSDNICHASDDPADIPSGYLCIKQVNGVAVCSPGGTVGIVCGVNSVCINDAKEKK